MDWESFKKGTNLKSILDSLPHITGVLDEEGYIITVNEKWEEFARGNNLVPEKSGHDINYFEAIDFENGKDCDKVRQAEKGIKAVLAGKEKEFSIEYPCHSQGSCRWFKMWIRPLENGAIVIHENITERRLFKLSLTQVVREQNKAERELKKTQFAIDKASIGVYRVSPEGIIKYANDRVVAQTGYEKEELIGRHVYETVVHNPPDREKHWRRLKNEEYITFESHHRTKDGEIFPVKVTSHYVNFGGKEYEFNFVRDITEKIKADRELEYKTYHDELTGLYNRNYLENRMEDLDYEGSYPISIITCDINGLRLINETYGSEVGDRVLVSVAGLMQNNVRDRDIVGRWSGDEFVILLPDTKLEIARDICQRIEENHENVKIEDEIPVSLGLGVGGSNEAEKEIFEILREAEDNMLRNKLTKRESGQNKLVQNMLNTLAAKSDETKEHALRMTNLAHRLGEKIELSNGELNNLSLLATLHDIGKATISEEILRKPGKLSEDEWEKIKKHPERGYNIASAAEEFAPVAEAILHHHEKWNGEGYPDGLAKKDIPLLSRIIAIVDAYDVMTSGRPYKEAVSREEALKEIEDCAGSQFDPELAEKFVKMIGNTS